MTAPVPSIHSVVFAPPTRSSRRFLPWALLVAGTLHGGMWLAAWNAAPGVGAWARRVDALVRADLGPEHTVEWAPEKPPPPPEPEEKTPTPKPPKAEQRHIHALVHAHKEEESPHAQPAPAPAQAGSVVTAQDDAPVDFSDTPLVTGKATAYAGGVTAAGGTNTVAVTSRNAVAGGAVGVGTGGGKPVAPAAKPAPVLAAPDLSTVVSLAEDDWSCPWPREADAEQVDEQTAVVRVMVAASGTVTQVQLMQDPGFGFGRAAVACAWKARFSAAKDRSGKPMDAFSPPIRVHFFR